MMARALLLFVTATACSRNPNRESPPEASTTPVAPAPTGPLAQRPPPAGVVIPSVGTAREVKSHVPGAAYDWYARIEVDPADPRLDRSKIATVTPDSPAGLAAAALHCEQLRASGVEASEEIDGCFYRIPGDLDVVILARDPKQPDTFEIFVGPAGG